MPIFGLPKVGPAFSPLSLRATWGWDAIRVDTLKSLWDAAVTRLGVTPPENPPLATSTGDFTTCKLRVDFAVFVDGRERSSLFLGRRLFELVE